MMRILFVILMLALAPAQAEIYKRVLPDGSVIFSDQPDPEAEQIEAPQPQTYRAPAPPPPAPTRPAPASSGAAAYQQLLITQPTEDQVIWDDSGQIPVHLSVTPPLQTEHGHRLLLTLDGHPVAEASTQLQYTLSDVDRGTHTLQATIRDAQGGTVLSSTGVTFHIKRHSILMPRPPAPQPPPP